jgi:BRCA1-associated protein
MYSLKVRGVRSNPPSDAATSSAQASPRPCPTDAAPNATSVDTETVDQVSFSAGNPRVEHITGVVHLYRHTADNTQLAQSSEDPPPPNMVASASPPPLPQDRSSQLCVLSLPPDMGFSEFCTFLGAYFERVREIRLVRRRGGGAKASCLVLLSFVTQDHADGFYTDFNGKAFCLLEPELLCRLVYVKHVQVSESEAASSLAAIGTASQQPPPLLKGAPAAAAHSEPPPPGTTELPSCPVCLDRLDAAISGIVTTVCNHRFHNQCLRQWGDTSCPVCRHCEGPQGNAPKCTACGTTSDLWACLICGHVGCGRYRGSHAADHWQECGHGYALELETQRVWDYASDAYVHRLVRSKTDGKLVEVPAPGTNGTCGECSAAAGSEAELCRGMDGEMEEALVASKLDALAQDYNHLLVTQLESQRVYFEGMMVRHRHELEAAASAATARAEEAQQAAEEAKLSMEKSENRLKSVEAKLADAQSKLASVRQEREFLKHLNDTLLANQKEFAEREKAAGALAAKRDAELAELREQVRDLMVFIQARDTISAAGEGEAELSGATVLPLPEQSGRGRAQGRRKK